MYTKKWLLKRTKSLKLSKLVAVFVVETNHKLLRNKWLKDKILKKSECKHAPCSAMSKGSWCDLNSKGDFLKLHDMCPKPKCNCPKQITFTPKEYQLEGAGFKSILQKNFEGTQSARNKFIKPAVNVAAPFIDMAVAAKC